MMMRVEDELLDDVDCDLFFRSKGSACSFFERHE